MGDNLNVVWIILIIILIIIFVTVVIIIVVIIVTGNDNNMLNKSCNSQNDCGQGYVCIQSNGGLCKATLGVTCGINSDCAGDLSCDNKLKICISDNKPKNIVNNTTVVNKIESSFVPNISYIPNTIPNVPNIQFNKSSQESVSLLLSDHNITPISGITSKESSYHSIRDNCKRKKRYSRSRCNSPTSIRSSFSDCDYNNYSSDSENNSYGNRSERDIFRIYSDEDEIFSSENYDSICVSSEGNKYCNRVSVINDMKQVVDVCSYSRYVLFLMANGDIISETENKQRKRIKNNIVGSRIVSFRGYLYCLFQDSMYILDNNTLDDNIWKWKICTDIVNKITHISATYDSKYLWVQTKHKCYLYDKHLNYNIYEKSKSRRIYGKNKKSYVDIDDKNHSAITKPRNEHLKGIKDVILDYYDNAIVIDKKDQKYQRLAVVNWQPYFIV